jgi:hypothetical protein
MKKNGLTTAIIAGFAGVAGIGSIADAVNLNPDGLGEVLIYPYYTVNAGNDTAISVVNTTAVGKAVKVRVLEGRNSREVLDFNLYLSRFDVWTAAIFSIPSGLPGAPAAGLLTTDRSCTAPDIARGGVGSAVAVGNGLEQLPDGRYYVPFVNFAYAPDSVSPAALGDGLERTREGYVEMIEMAEVLNGTTAGNWITHSAAGEPGNCTALNISWFGQPADATSFAATGGVGGTPAAPWTDIPTGGLFGNGFIVKPANGTVLAYEADALQGFLFSRQHTDPGNLAPNLANVQDPPAPPGVPGVDPATNSQATAYVFDGTGVIAATYDALPNSAAKVDAISALYASPRVMNEYYLDDEVVTGTTEWVLNFPTKRFHVDDDTLLGGGSIVTAVRPPFFNAFNNGSCETITATIYDREERTVVQQGGGFSPPRPGEPPSSLCWEAQVVTFDQSAAPTGTSRLLGSTYANNLATAFDFGWASINFVGGGGGAGAGNTPAMRPSVASTIDPTVPAGRIFRGLPVTGFFAFNYDNANSPSGTLANYSGLYRHRTERQCQQGSLTAPGICS